MSDRIRPHRTVALGVALGLLAACGGGGDDDVESSTASTASRGASSSTTSATTSSAPADASVTTSVVDAGTPASTAPARDTVAGSPQPVAAGTYAYAQRGTRGSGEVREDVDPEGTLTVAPPEGGDQRWERRIDPDGPPSDTLWRFDGAGMLLVSSVTRVDTGAAVQTFECVFDAPVPAPPWPPTEGATFSGTADCDGFTAELEGTVGAPTTATVGGERVVVHPIDTTIRTTGQVTSTIEESVLFSAAHRLPVLVERRATGRYGIVEFSEEVVLDLQSLQPR